MREILFRGKRADNGEWVYGRLLADDVIVPKGQEFETEDIYIIADNLMGFTVIPETVGQYTGLTDKNGKKIFEGDIIEYEHELGGYLQFEIGEDYKPRRSHSCYWDDEQYLHYKRNYAVEWKEKDARWILRNGSDQHDLRRISLTMHNGTIIGNIHDNPELLKVGD